MRAVAQANLSASLHDPRVNQLAWHCGCRASADMAKANTVGEATANATVRSTGVLGMARTTDTPSKLGTLSLPARRSRAGRPRQRIHKLPSGGERLG